MNAAEKTHVVALSSASAAVSPVLRLSDGSRAVIHSSANYVNDGLNVYRNYDLYFDIEPFSSGSNLPSLGVIQFPRYDKNQQQAMLRSAEEAYRSSQGMPSYYVPVQSYSYNYASRPYLAPGERLVVKPEGGARGLCQFVIDPSRVALNHFLHNWIPTTVNALTAIEGSDDALKAALQDKVLADFGDSVKFYPGNESYLGEAVNLFKSFGSRYIAQKLIQDIKAEYRIITGATKPIGLMVERGFHMEDPGVYRQATGSGAHSTKVEASELLTPNSIHFLNYLIQHAIGPLRSIDLFITTDGHWGIFEFSSEFGVTGLHRHDTDAIWADVIEHYLKNQPSIAL